MTFWGQRCADIVWWVVIIKAWKRPLLTNSRPVINLNDGRNLLFSPKSSRVVEHTERKGAELVPKKEMFQKIFISHDPSVTATICSRIVSVPGQKLVPNWLSRLKGGGLWGATGFVTPSEVCSFCSFGKYWHQTKRTLWAQKRKLASGRSFMFTTRQNLTSLTRTLTSPSRRVGWSGRPFLKNSPTSAVRPFCMKFGTQQL